MSRAIFIRSPYNSACDAGAISRVPPLCCRAVVARVSNDFAYDAGHKQVFSVEGIQRPGFEFLVSQLFRFWGGAESAEESRFLRVRNGRSRSPLPECHDCLNLITGHSADGQVGFHSIPTSRPGGGLIL